MGRRFRTTMWTGSSDIVVAFGSTEGFLVLLIENKIDAEFQPDQPERYRDRAVRWQGLLPSITLALGDKF